MSEEIKSYTKIAGVSLGKGAIIWVVGILFTLIFALIAFYQALEIWDKANIHGGGHAGEVMIIPLAIILFKANPATFLLLISTAPMIGAYFFVGNRMIIQNAIHGIWKQKAESILMKRVKDVSESVVRKTDQWDELMNAAVARVKLLKENQNHPDTNRLKRRLIKYLFKKINLDNADLEQDKNQFPDKIAVGIADYISEMARPSWRLFLILLGLQFFCLILSFFL